MSVKLTKVVVDRAKTREGDYFVWDSEIKGFGLKVSRGGRKSYVCKYRFGFGRRAPTKRMTIGVHGSPWTVDQARLEARKILGRVANGEDPATLKQESKNKININELCDLYLRDGLGTKKASTIASDIGRIKRHIKPLLGHKSVADLTKADVKRFLQDVANGKTAIDVKTKSRGRSIVRGGKGTATRTVGLLGGILSYAMDCGLRDDNPVRGVKRFPDAKMERYLNESELKALGRALSEAEQRGENPFGIAIIKLLILTGARKGEIESLKWDEVDLQSGYLRLADSKTGQKIIPLNRSAAAVLDQVQKFNHNKFVFPSLSKNGFYKGTSKLWCRIRSSIGLDEVRLHDLRHTFASVAVSGGASLPMIGAMLGHKDSATTQRYAHLQDDPLKAATEEVGGYLGSAIASNECKSSH